MGEAAGRAPGGPVVTEKRIAKITGTTLGIEDHGIATAVLIVDYGGSGQGIGGHVLSKRRDGVLLGTAYGMTFVLRLLAACGVDTWEQVKGRTIHVLLENGRPVGIENLPTEPGTGHDLLGRVYEAFPEPREAVPA